MCESVCRLYIVRNAKKKKKKKKKTIRVLESSES